MAVKNHGTIKFTSILMALILLLCGCEMSGSEPVISESVITESAKYPEVYGKIIVYPDGDNIIIEDNGETVATIEGELRSCCASPDGRAVSILTYEKGADYFSRDFEGFTLYAYKDKLKKVGVKVYDYREGVPIADNGNICF
jgi:hypothetical protein